MQYMPTIIVCSDRFVNNWSRKSCLLSFRTCYCDSISHARISVCIIVDMMGISVFMYAISIVYGNWYEHDAILQIEVIHHCHAEIEYYHLIIWRCDIETNDWSLDRQTFHPILSNDNKTSISNEYKAICQTKYIYVSSYKDSDKLKLNDHNQHRKEINNVKI